MPIVPLATFSPTHDRPAPHGCESARHAAPDAAYATHVPVDAVTGITHARSRPQSAASEQVAPATGSAAHVPQIAVCGIEQNVLAHCPEAPHAIPFAFEPAGATQAVTGLPLKKSGQLSLGYAAAHASTPVGVWPVPDAASAD